MASNLPLQWDEGVFVDDVSRHPELYDISHELYSNNKNWCYIFRQLGVTHSVEGI